MTDSSGHLSKKVEERSCCYSFYIISLNYIINKIYDSKMIVKSDI